MFYDYMVFDADNFCFSLHMTHNGITLAAFDFEDEPKDSSRHLTDIRREIESLIVKITEQVFPNLTCVPFLQCTCIEPGSSFPSDADAK